MSIPVLIMGESGAGKSTSLRNLDPKECLLIKMLDKPLPFKSSMWKVWDSESKTGSVITTDSSDKICKIIKGAGNYGKKIIIIDDYQYLMANEFMREAETKGYDKFTLIAKHAWEVVKDAMDGTASDMRVYFLSHSTVDEFGRTKAKLIGKMLDEKIVLEGMFTVVLKALIENEKHYFSTKSSGQDTVKSPMGMFEDRLIENDLNLVDNIICDYYNIEKQAKGLKDAA